MYFKTSTSSHWSSLILITVLKGTSAEYLPPADSALTFSRLLYYPLYKREPDWSVALCNESFSRVANLVWNKESGSNIKLCPITIITDLSIGWDGGHSLSAGPIQTYHLDNNLELMPSIMEYREQRKGEGGGGYVCTRKKKTIKGSERNGKGGHGKIMTRKDVRMSLSPFPPSLSLRRTEE